MAGDKKNSNLQNLPVSAVEFIRLVIKKMRYRKGVRRDVQAELTAHFEDELKECTTDKEREQKARQLIAGFGDAKLLAVLLRRAKKRCRPLWRTVVARTSQVVCIIIVCFTLYVVWFFSGKPVITTDYFAELNRIARPVADENLNAAPSYHKAVEMVKELPDDISRVLGKTFDETASEEKQVLAKWLSNNEEILQLVITGARKPYYWRQYATKRVTPDLMGVLLPDLSEFKNLARTLCWRAQLSAQAGQYENAFEDLKACYRFGQHLKTSGAFLIEQLVGFAIQNLAAGNLRDILSRYEIDVSTLAKLQKDFEEIVAGEEFNIDLAAERLAVFDVIQRLFTGGLGGGHIIPKLLAQFYPEVQVISTGAAATAHPEGQDEGWHSQFISAVEDVLSDAGRMLKKGGYILFFHPDKQQTFQAAQELYDYWESLKLKTPGQIRAEAIPVEEETKKIIGGNVLLELMAPAPARCMELAYCNKCSTESLIAVIALLRYKKDKGSYPDNLQELVTAGYLKELPLDPYSDKLSVYRRTDDNFILYSLGENFKDDGGEVVRKGKSIRKWGTSDAGDAVFWPPPKSQTEQRN
jgi:predicted house-cleaning noncanonical NTP pyrophosphatase (MazG superfamily)